MARNLADPEYEPSDEELQQLAHDAFAEVPERHREATRRLWEQIAVLRAQVMARLAGSSSSTS
jgi:predicted Zn-dependent protease with MMP-like domain